MKKSLIAVAVAGLFAAPVAMADVAISGAINLGVQVGKSGSDTAGNSGLSRNQLFPSYSNFNLSSTDDIGNGNKVIFNYQFDISGTSSANPGSAGGAIGNRNSYLGFAGNWGAFKMGTNENVYERYMYQADPTDGAMGTGGNLNILGTPGAGTVFEVGQGNCGPANGCVGFYRRAEQTIWYESPNWNGFTFEVDYSLSAFKSAGPTGTDPKILSIGGKYAPEGMPFYVDVAYEKHDDMFGANKISGVTTGSGSSDTGLQIGGGWMLGDLGLHLRYEMLSYETDGLSVAGDVSQVERDAIWFAVKYSLPSGYIGAQLGIAKEYDCVQVGGGCTAPDTGAKMFGIGYFHNLSKQSQLQFVYGRTDNDRAGSYIQIGAPLSGDGADHQAFLVNLKHTF